MFFENGFHGGPRDRFDPQLAQRAEDEGVAPVVLSGEFQDQIADVAGGARATDYRGCCQGCFLVSSMSDLSLSNPAAEGRVADDGDEFAELDAEIASELDEAGFFGGSGDDSRGES